MSRVLRYEMASSRFFGSSLSSPSASASTAPCQSKPASAMPGRTSSVGAAPSSDRARALVRSRFMPAEYVSTRTREHADRPLDLLAQAVRQIELEHALVLGECGGPVRGGLR